MASVVWPTAQKSNSVEDEKLAISEVSQSQAGGCWHILHHKNLTAAARNPHGM